MSRRAMENRDTKPPATEARSARTEQAGHFTQIARRALPPEADPNNSSWIIDFRSILHTTRWNEPGAPKPATRSLLGDADESEDKTPVPSVRSLSSARSDVPVSIDGGALSDAEDGAANGQDPLPDEDEDAHEGSRARAWKTMLPGFAAAGLVGAAAALLVSIVAPGPSAPGRVVALSPRPAATRPSAKLGLPTTAKAPSKEAATHASSRATSVEASGAAVRATSVEASSTSVRATSIEAPRAPSRAAPVGTSAATGSAQADSPAPWRPSPAARPASKVALSASPAAKSPPPSGSGTGQSAPPPAPSVAPDPCNGDLMCAMKRAVGETK